MAEVENLMPSSVRWGIVLVINAFLLLVVLKYTDAQVRQAALYNDSVTAAADTAREVHLQALGDSTNAWQRRIIQMELTRDSLDKELDAQPVVRVAAGVRIDTLRFVDTVSVPAVQADSGRLYTWEDDDGPFKITGSATISPAWLGVFSARVIQTDSIAVGIRIQCAAGPGGVNSASVLLTGREPLSLVPGRVVQDPQICNPVQPILALDVSPKGLLVVGGVIGAWEIVKFLLRR